MGLLDILRRSQEGSNRVAGKSVARAGEILEDAERRIRRKMRIHPRLRPQNTTISPAPNGQFGNVPGRDTPPKAA